MGYLHRTGPPTGCGNRSAPTAMIAPASRPVRSSLWWASGIHGLPDFEHKIVLVSWHWA